MDGDNQVNSVSTENHEQTKINEQNIQTDPITDEKNVIDVIGNGQLVKKVEILFVFFYA